MFLHPAGNNTAHANSPDGMPVCLQVLAQAVGQVGSIGAAIAEEGSGPRRGAAS
jgi:hypothetical protein